MKIHYSNSGLKFIYLNKPSKGKCLIKFLDTGTVKEVYVANASKGKVTDQYSATAYGKGYIGDPKNVPYKKQAKQLWNNVLKRCYSTKDSKGYYGRVVVSPRWLCFANFLEDLPKLKNFELWLDKQGYELDKDKKGDGTVYDVNTCQFLSSFENRSIQPNYRTGKTFNKVTGK